MLLTGSKELEPYSSIFERIADIATLVARYNVLESMYQNWQEMTIEKNYEESLVVLCTLVLEYLTILLNPRGELPAAVSNQYAKIVAADTACRGFTVTFENITAKPDLIEDISREVKDSDSDSDCPTLGTKIKPSVGDQRQSLKRSAGQISNVESGATRS
jgi:hypothetical protein